MISIINFKPLAIVSVLVLGLASADFSFAESKKSDKVMVDRLGATAAELSSQGRFEESNALFQKIMVKYELTDKQQDEVYYWLSVNANLEGHYRACYKYLQLRNDKSKPGDSLDDMKHLANQPVQFLKRPEKDVTINYFVDSLYYKGVFKGCEIRIPVIIGDKEENLILDNGCAQFCVARESFAKEHGIRPIGAEGKAVGVVEAVTMWLGIADVLRIGEMTFHNIIFTVIPDKYIDNEVLEVNAMIGGNVFRMAGEMQFDNVARKIVFPYEQRDRTRNLTIDTGGVHYARAQVGRDSLTVQLDLGAASTSLNCNYFNKHKKDIKASCKTKTNHIGGVGGTQEETIYEMPEMTISTCGGVFVKEEAKISTKKRPNEDNEDGALGNDFLLSFKKAVLNLKKMYLYVE